MERGHVAAAIITLALAGSAQARSAVPVIDMRDQAFVTVSGSTPALEQVRAAIVKAAFDLGWTLAAAGEQGFVGTLVVRAKHTVAVDITFDAKKVSVTYRSSDNMKFEIRDNVRVIHPNYNVWSRALLDRILSEVGKL